MYEKKNIEKWFPFYLFSTGNFAITLAIGFILICKNDFTILGQQRSSKVLDLIVSTTMRWNIKLKVEFVMVEKAFCYTYIYYTLYRDFCFNYFACWILDDSKEITSKMPSVNGMWQPSFYESKPRGCQSFVRVKKSRIRKGRIQDINWLLLKK